MLRNIQAEKLTDLVISPKVHRSTIGISLAHDDHAVITPVVTGNVCNRENPAFRIEKSLMTDYAAERHVAQIIGFPDGLQREAGRSSLSQRDHQAMTAENLRTQQASRREVWLLSSSLSGERSA